MYHSDSWAPILKVILGDFATATVEVYTSISHIPTLTYSASEPSKEYLLFAQRGYRSKSDCFRRMAKKWGTEGGGEDFWEEWCRICTKFSEVRKRGEK